MRNAALKQNGGRSRTARRYLVVGLLTAGAAVYFFESARGEYAVTTASAVVAAPAAPDALKAARVPGGDAAPRAPETRHRQLAFEIERALISGDVQQRETAFASLLPELLVAEPTRVADMVARTEPGEARGALLEEVTRQWIVQDRDAAVAWMRSLSDENERRTSAVSAVRRLAASSPARAIEVADEFGIGRDDGSLEHLVQIWATENPDEARHWADSQPDGPATAQLRARIEQVRAQSAASDH